MNPTEPLPIELSTRQRELLDRTLRQRKCPSGLAKRLHIVLDAADGKSNRAIERERGISDYTVRRWRRRFHEALPRIGMIEADADTDDRMLLDALIEALSDQPRSGRPPVFTAEQLTSVIAIACEEPDDSDRPISHWSAREVADEAVKRGIVESISRRHVGRFLQSGGSQTASDQVLAEPEDHERG